MRHRQSPRRWRADAPSLVAAIVAAAAAALAALPPARALPPPLPSALPAPTYPPGTEGDPYRLETATVDTTVFDTGDMLLQAPGLEARRGNATARAANDLYFAAAVAAARARGEDPDATVPASEANGTYALVADVLRVTIAAFALITTSPISCARLAFFRGELRAVGLVAYCPGRPFWLPTQNGSSGAPGPWKPMNAVYADWAAQYPLPCGLP